MKKMQIIILNSILILIILLMGCEGANVKEAAVTVKKLENSIEFTLSKVGKKYDDKIGYRNITWFYHSKYPGDSGDVHQQIIGPIETWKLGEKIYVGLNIAGNWTYSKENNFTIPLPNGNYFISTIIEEDDYSGITNIIV